MGGSGDLPKPAPGSAANPDTGAGTSRGAGHSGGTRGPLHAGGGRRGQRRRPTRWWAAAVVVAVGAAVAGYLASQGTTRVASAPPSSTPAHHAGVTPKDTTTTAAPVPSTTTTTTSPGTLPQTDTLPPASSPQFASEMAALWQGIMSGSVTPAMPAFFPEGAYVQLKSLPTPRADFEERLVHDYGLDIQAAHALLGTGSATASLVSVSVPETDAHWIPPGVCDNSIGYYEVPNARVVYLAGGATRSFGIASMISWRGEWYIVHLGTVLRPTTTTQGRVDDPATGPGVSAPSSTC